MKTKIVLWGSNEKEEKILIGIELIEDVNMIKVHSFPEEVATEEFYNQMMNLWREGTHIPFPDGHQEYERKLSMTDDILPDNLKTKRTDILARAKTEWHFVVLSSKLYSNYHDEIEDMKERVADLKEFDDAIWEELKGFWDKVQNQVREKNLFREHGNTLRQQTNELFGTMKSLRKSLNEDLEKASKETLQKFLDKLEKIDEKIQKGLGLQPIFNELKDVQRKFKDADLTNRHKNDLWKRIDKAFKTVKEKRYGKDANSNNSLVRVTRRQEGLLSAINKMQQSIDRDKNELNFQQNRINSSEGQLEVQLRQAKFAMIEERISSKQKKLDEMLETKVQLEQKMAQEAEKEKARKAAEEVKAKEVEIKNSIAEGIQSKNEELKEKAEVLESAAEAIKETKGKSFIERAKAKMDEVIDDIKEEVEEAKEEASKILDESKKTGILASAKAKMDEVIHDVKEEAEELKAKASEKIEEAKSSDFISKAKAKIHDIVDDIKEETAEVLEDIQEKIEDVVENLKNEEE